MVNIGEAESSFQTSRACVAHVSVVRRCQGVGVPWQRLESVLIWDLSMAWLQLPPQTLASVVRVKIKVKAC